MQLPPPRYWALPIEWQSVSHRILLAYPAGYQYGQVRQLAWSVCTTPDPQYHHHDFLYPKYGWCVAN